MKCWTNFKGATLYFNHFFRVDEKDVLNRQRLKASVARGAAAFFSDRQENFDIVISFLLGDSETNPSVVESHRLALICSNRRVRSIFIPLVVQRYSSQYYISYTLPMSVYA